MPSTVPSRGERWRAAREAAGLTVRQAADVSGSHHNTIYDLEKDDEGVTLRWMLRYADAIGARLSEIFAEEGEAPERVPAELRPLVQAIAPLSQAARESIVRNIASNLRFMSLLYVGAAETLQTEGSNSSKPGTTVTDDTREITIPLPRAGTETTEQRKPKKGPADTARE